MKRPAGRRGFEVLERRDLMAWWGRVLTINDHGPLDPAGIASEVTAEVIDGKLVVRGGAGADGVTITQAGGRYLISANNGWTRVNGKSSANLNFNYLELAELAASDPAAYDAMFRVVITGVTAGIDVDLGDGDDFVQVRGQALPRVDIRMGAGDDRVHIDGHIYDLYPTLATTGWYRPPAFEGSIGGNLHVETGAGDDSAWLFVNVTGDAIVQMGDGEDLFLEPDLTYRDPGDYPVRLKAGGQRIVDLGAGQEGYPPAADWRDDEDLVSLLDPRIITIFEQYAADLAAGVAVPGQPWQRQIVNDWMEAQIDGSGRLKLQLFFNTGSQAVIDRLVERGVVVDGYTLSRGIAEVSLRADELRLLTNMQGIGQISFRRNELSDADVVRPLPGVPRPPASDFPSLDSQRDGSGVYGPQPLPGTVDLPVTPPSEPEPELLLEPIVGPDPNPERKFVHPIFAAISEPIPASQFVTWDGGRIDGDILKAFAGDTSIYRRKFSYGFPGASQDYDPAHGYYGQLEPDGTLQVELNFRTRDPAIIETLRSQVTRLGSFYSGPETGIADAWITLEDLEQLNANEELIQVHIPFGVVFN